MDIGRASTVGIDDDLIGKFDNRVVRVFDLAELGCRVGFRRAKLRLIGGEYLQDVVHLGGDLLGGELIQVLRNIQFELTRGYDNFEHLLFGPYPDQIYGVDCQGVSYGDSDGLRVAVDRQDSVLLDEVLGELGNRTVVD